MVRYKILFFLLACPLSLAATSPVAEGERALLFQLALEKAKADGLDKDPAVREGMDRVLYKAFLQKQLLTAGDSLEPTRSDLRTKYQQYPLVRLRHLYLPAKNAAQTQKANQTLKEVQKLVLGGADFRKLVLKYSEDDSARWGGDLDFRGVNSLPESFYQPALKLKKGELSAPIVTGDALHLIQLLEVQPFEQAFAVYLQFLRTELKAEREEKFLTSVLAGLKRDGKPAMPSAGSQSE